MARVGSAADDDDDAVDHSADAAAGVVLGDAALGGEGDKSQLIQEQS
jgi:hypothetical protein